MGPGQRGLASVLACREAGAEKIILEFGHTQPNADGDITFFQYAGDATLTGLTLSNGGQATIGN